MHLKCVYGSFIFNWKFMILKAFDYIFTLIWEILWDFSVLWWKIFHKSLCDNLECAALIVSFILILFDLNCARNYWKFKIFHVNLSKNAEMWKKEFSFYFLKHEIIRNIKSRQIIRNKCEKTVFRHEIFFYIQKENSFNWLRLHAS